ncbi:Rhodanese-related sulfurtransferase [Desulfonatronum thiosulfatophilum]|uniref:Rhodanese-related sulfurtransferase n=1 Tax=Desulfonatronum thiosulfatophilum TaxID=617002 RepID=A0A1G6CCT7_9BACT|nr:rhodanese-like domain-containing protein [Desulfonatronum thiosulfatophilum]SDB30695.1 Rhodanese-related sulfurtransferase [Desulfonatronum thiosulfatophilum]
MRWMQFLTPVKSIDAEQARKVLTEEPELQIVDVRQPGEYEQGHIAGARLMPIGQLGDMMSELDGSKPTLVYCAIGGRSRVAAQMLAGKGFEKILNLSGGFKAWNGWTGFGEYELGLHLFTESMTLEQTLAVAYDMESALREFYENMAETVADPQAGKVFALLAAVELKHQQAVAQRMAGEDVQKATQKTAKDTPAAVPEGGISTEDHMHRMGVDLENPREIVDFAMAVEAQAMDLYSRAARQAQGEVREFLEQMAEDEKKHLQHLGNLMDRLQEVV